jgi:ABC-type phosphate transport system substrate-binding protein
MLQKKDPSILNWSLIVALATTAPPIAVTIAPVLAQTASPSPTFSLPTTVSKGTTVQIDGSSSMAAVNQTLKQRFETRFPGTAINVGYGGTPTALKALVDGKVDLVAIGRSLTADEKAQGLVAVPVGREKIAIVVGSDNPFKKSLTIRQYAKIFRGEITNWSEVGGAPGAIRVVDRPDVSDTRQSFRNYPIFKSAEFKTGGTAQPVSEDSTGTVIPKLGVDGIGYAIANQARETPGIRPLLMHNTLPDDPRYPFSQPLAYVYKGTPSPAVAAFLGYATAPDEQQAIRSAKADSGAIAAGSLGAGGVVSLNAIASPGVSPAISPTVSSSATVSPSLPPTVDSSSPTASPEMAQAAGGSTEAVGSSRDSGIPPWLLWLLPLGLLGLLLWWLFGKRGSEDAIVPPTSEVTPVSPSETTPPEEVLDPASRAGSVINSDRAAIAETRTIPESTEGVSPEILGGAAGAAAGGALEDDRGSLPEVDLTSLEEGVEDFAVAADPTIVAAIEPPDSISTSRIEESVLPDVTPSPDISAPRILGGAAAAGAGIAAGQDDDSILEVPPSTDLTAEVPLETSIDPIPLSDPQEVAATGSFETDSFEDESSATEMDSPGQPLTDVSATSSSYPQGVAGGAALVTGAAWVTRSGQSPSSASVPDLEASNLETSNLETVNLAEEPLVTLDAIAELDDLEAIVDADSDMTVDDDAPLIIEEDATVLDLSEAGVTVSSSDPLEVVEPSILGVSEGAALGATPGLPGMAAISSSDPQGVVGGAALAAGAAAWSLPTDSSQSDVEAAKFDVGQNDLTSETLATVDEGLLDLPDGYGESRIVLLPRDPQWAYAYWDVPIEHRMQLRQQGGQNLVLRLCDVTDVDLDHQSPHSLQQFDCDELAREWYVAIPVSDRDYLVEIGYMTVDGRWLMLARSLPVRIPPIYPSDWFEDQFATIDWEEDLRGNTFLELVPPGTRSAAMAINPIYERIFGMAQGVEAQRVAGSLFGSMQQVPQQAISSFVFPSGMGMGALTAPGVGLPNFSGIGMSGIGMSGIGMSGIGMSGVGMGASMPPLRPRKFWLVADAELIVYGATEPDAKVTIAGQPVKLNPDGTFRFQMSFQDGVIDYPILAVAADGEQTRSVHMNFTRETPRRNTNTKDEATDEWF